MTFCEMLYTVVAIIIYIVYSIVLSCYDLRDHLSVLQFGLETAPSLALQCKYEC